MAAKEDERDSTGKISLGSSASTSFGRRALFSFRFGGSFGGSSGADLTGSTRRAGSSRRSRKSKTLSVTAPPSPAQESYSDETRLYNALREAGRYASGVDAVEAWVLDDMSLVQPAGGWYRDPGFKAADSEALARIEDKTRNDYVAPPSQLPGTGLAGCLWTANGDGRHNLLDKAMGFLEHHTYQHGDDDIGQLDDGQGTTTGQPRLDGPRRHSSSGVSMRNLFSKATSFRLSAVSSGNTGGNLSLHSNISMDSSGKGERRSIAMKQAVLLAAMEEGNEASESPSDVDPANLKKTEKIVELAPPEAPAQSTPSLEGATSQGRPPKRQSRPSMVRRASVALFRRGSTSVGLKELGTNDLEAVDALHARQHERGLLWRDIYSLTSDPDQPTFLRLKLLEDAGFGKAAGIRFEFQGQKGIVLFLAQSVTPEETLNAPENVAYMKAAAQLVGASVALEKPKRAAIEAAEKTKREEVNEENEDDDEDEADGSEFFYYLRSYGKKLKGGNLQPPPPMEQGESILTFFGAFVTLLLLAFTSKSIQEATEKENVIVLGPFGALMTLQYGLAMAPASQPRNALYGQSIAIGIALMFAYIPETALPLWVRVPLATACAIASMTRLGITHPPAGAAALIIASGDFDWMILPLMLLGNVIAWITATLINNLSDKRQYPTYLSFGVWYFIKSCFEFCILFWQSILCCRVDGLVDINQQNADDNEGSKTPDLDPSKRSLDLDDLKEANDKTSAAEDSSSSKPEEDPSTQNTAVALVEEGEEEEKVVSA